MNIDKKSLQQVTCDVIFEQQSDILRMSLFPSLAPTMLRNCVIICASHTANERGLHWKHPRQYTSEKCFIVHQIRSEIPNSEIRVGSLHHEGRAIESIASECDVTGHQPHVPQCPHRAWRPTPFSEQKDIFPWTLLCWLITHTEVK